MPKVNPILADSFAVADGMYPSMSRVIGSIHSQWGKDPKLMSLIDSYAAGDITSQRLMVDASTLMQRLPVGAASKIASNAKAAADLFLESMSLDATSNAVLWADKYAGSRITSLRNASVTSVRDYVASAIQEEIPVRLLKQQIEHVVKLDTRFTSAAIRRYKAQRASERKNSATGRDQAAYVKRAANIKAKQIARTETQLALNYGRYQALYAARAEGLLEDTDKLLWIAAPDCCDQCAAYGGTTASLDSGFGSAAPFPPLHPNCRCTIGLA